MYTDQRELLQSQMNVGEVNKSNSLTELVEREQIKGSPYWIIGNKDDGYMLTFAKYQFSEKFKTKKEVEDYLDKNSYDIVLKTILSAMEIKESNK